MATTTGSSRTRWLPWAITGAVLVVAVAVTAGAFLVLGIGVSGEPEFPSLQAQPDPSLSGTVAYFDDESLCVRAVSASGEHDQEVYCLEEDQPADPMAEGKNIGVDIEWTSDNRLQLTLYRMSVSKDPGPPSFFPAWRKVVDVRTGSVQEVPASEFAGAEPDHPCVTVSPSGERVVTESDSGRAVVTLQTAAGDRTLLDVRGNPETYGIKPACWAPNYQWIATSDTRMLVITTGEPPLTRTLTPPMTSFYGYDALAWYAITPANILAEE